MRPAKPQHLSNYNPQGLSHELKGFKHLSYKWLWWIFSITLSVKNIEGHLTMYVTSSTEHILQITGSYSYQRLHDYTIIVVNSPDFGSAFTWRSPQCASPEDL